MADNHVELDIAQDRINAGIAAGDEYVSKLESIRDELTVTEGATLGTMVGAQLKMTETETEYMVEAGIPKKASGANMQAAQEVKKAAG